MAKTSSISQTTEAFSFSRLVLILEIIFFAQTFGLYCNTTSTQHCVDENNKTFLKAHGGWMFML